MAAPAAARAASSLTVALPEGRSYALRFRPLAELPARMTEAGLRRGRCLVVTDEHVAGHYRRVVEEALGEAGWTPHVLVLPPGEPTKSAGHVRRIYDEALAWGIDRRTPVVALGGGVVGDVAGFAAATLLRGLPLVQCPTTLIAQVDSALGGKTGINHVAGKNLVGAFHQPRLVLADVHVLRTLPEREWTSGLAEVIKHALIADPALFTFIEEHIDAVLERDLAVVGRLVPRAAHVKIRIVQEDEREQGRRAILNFGHTFGHAIERVAGYGAFTHGEAVALGMRAALWLSHRLHGAAVPFERADRLVRRIPVPSGLAALDTGALNEAMQSDKKARAGRVRFVLMRRLGAAYLTADVAKSDVQRAWAYAKEE